MMYWFGSDKMDENFIFIDLNNLPMNIRIRMDKREVSTRVREEHGELKTLQTLMWLVGAEILILCFVRVMQRTHFS